jgi:hypothetical protein
MSKGMLGLYFGDSRRFDSHSGTVKFLESELKRPVSVVEISFTSLWLYAHRNGANL